MMLLITLRGGLVSIIYTDIVSFVVTLLFFPAVALLVGQSAPLNHLAISDVIDSGAKVLPPTFVISLVVLSMFTYILAPWYGQKIFAARSEKVAYLSVFVAALLVFALYSLVVLSAAFLSIQKVALPSPEYALPYILHNLLPKGLCGLGYSLLFTASATTLMGVWNAMASLFIVDFSKQTHSYKRAMLATTAFAFLSYALSNLFIDKIFDKLILANIPIAALSFALLAGFYWKKASRFGAYCSTGVGLIWGVGCYLWWGEAGGYTWYWAIYGIPLTFVSGVAGSYCQLQKITNERSGFNTTT